MPIAKAIGHFKDDLTETKHYKENFGVGQIPNQCETSYTHPSHLGLDIWSMKFVGLNIYE